MLELSRSRGVSSVAHLTVVAFLLTVPGASRAEQPISVPPHTRGKHVYAIPSGFVPPLVGAAGVAELEREAAKLRFPFYIVFVESLPGSGDEDARAARAVDHLAETWAERGAGYDVATSQVFLLSYSPRKYRFLAGARFRAELGFEREAHAPYTRIFDAAVSGTPKDPKGGILGLMKAVDEHLFDATDPGRVAARRAQEALAAQRALEAAQVAERDGARAQLLAEADALERLVARDGHEAEDVARARAVVGRARLSRTIQATGDLLSLAGEVRAVREAIEARAEARLAQVERQEARRNLAVVLAMVILCGSGLFVAFRRRSRSAAAEALEVELGDWAERIERGTARYVDFYGERDALLPLASAGGETSQLFSAVTREVDSIYTALRAMELQVERCRALARSAGPLSVAPLLDAVERLEAPFEIDTGELAKADLFGPPTKKVRLDPTTLAAELEDRFRRSQEGWARLHAAAELRDRPARAAFPTDGLDRLLARAKEQAVPELWLADHPLFGDDASDATLYDGLEAVRATDPVAYLSRLEGLRAQETGCAARLERVVAARASLDAVRVAQVSHRPTVLDPSDDPRVTLAEAQRFEERMARAIEAVAGVEAVEAAAAGAKTLFERVRVQLAEIDAAVEGTERSSKATRGRAAHLAAELAEVERAVGAGEAHHHLDEAHADLDEARRDLAAGAEQVNVVTTLLAASRHLEARRASDRAGASLEAAARAMGRARERLAEGERLRAEYFAKRQSLERGRAEAASRIARYGGSAGDLAVIPGAYGAGRARWSVLLAELSGVESSWRDAERRAKRAYEVAQEAQREAEESARRAREAREASERRSSSHYASSWGHGSSSSRSSSSRSGSSSSGGSWGGSSGSSSSGGSW